MGFLEWLEGLPVAIWVAESDWGYPIMLSVHSVGMAAVVGLLMMLDVRVLGFAQRIPVTSFRRFMPYAWAGFVLNFVSGALLFASTASRLASNWPFVLKMVAIVIGGVVSWQLWKQLATGTAVTAVSSRRKPGASSDAETEPVITKKARVSAWISLSVWLLAIIFGRLIAYVMDHSILQGA